MPPTDQNPVSVIRHLTRLLSAVAHSSSGQIRIPQTTMDMIVGGGDPKALFESYDYAKAEIVLEFRPKSLATYLVEEPKQCQPETTSGTQSSVTSHSDLPNSEKPGVARPLSDDQLASAERMMNRIKAARRAGIPM